MSRVFLNSLKLRHSHFKMCLLVEHGFVKVVIFPFYCSKVAEFIGTHQKMFLTLNILRSFLGLFTNLNLK